MEIETLSRETDGKGRARKLLTRSCIVASAVLALIVVVSFLPHARRHSVSKGRSDASPGECAKHVLRHVHVLHRHGERTPIHWFKFEGDWGWKKEDLAPGKLTSRGMGHGYQLGQKLRLQYDHSVNLSPKQVKVYSTDYDRTVDTVQSLLLGMYSRSGTATDVQDVCACREEQGTRSSPVCIAKCIGINSDSLPTIPSVITVTDPSIAVYQALYQAKECKGWDAWLESVEATSEWKDAVDDKFTDAKNTLATLVGSDTVNRLVWPDGTCQGCADIDDPDFNLLGLMEQAWSNLECYNAANKNYSSDISNDELLEILQPTADFSWKTRYDSSKGKFTGGMLLDQMIKKFESISTALEQCYQAGKTKDCTGSGASMTIYSAHDTTVYSILAALGAAEKLPIPRFASHLRAELWERAECPKKKSQFEVRLFYDSNVDGATFSDKMIESPACPDGTCSLNSFVKATRSMVIPASQCQKKDSQYEQVLLGTECCK